METPQYYIQKKYIEWDSSSEFISKELKATAFSLHIHDGDLWMYILYHNGEVVDQFNPVPDYWDENISEDDVESWKGNTSIITKYVSYVKKSDIENYLVKWDGEEEDIPKAYPADEFERGEWQMVDFMNKLRLPYPIDDNGNPKGKTYKIWTEQLPIESQEKNNIQQNTSRSEKPWWKFW